VEYSVIGKGPEGYDEEQPGLRLETRDDGVYVELPPVCREGLKHKPSHLLVAPAGGRAAAGARHLHDRHGRGQPALLDVRLPVEHAVGISARRRGHQRSGPELTFVTAKAITPRRHTRALAVRHHAIRPTSSRRLTRPAHWADVVLIATPIRGNASSLYFKMVERLNCIQNQLTIHNRRLIMNKVAALIITGGQDNIQAVAGGMLTFWSELGFVFPVFPFIAHSRGWDAEDMQNNVRQVRESQPLRTAAAELAERALGTWRVLDRHRAEMGRWGAPGGKPTRSRGPEAEAEAAP
jgi:hypothetical protein